MLPKGRCCIVSNGHIKALLTSQGLMAIDREGSIHESFEAGISRRIELASFFRGRGEETDANEAMFVVGEMLKLAENFGER
jgi:hypothetical protein